MATEQCDVDVSNVFPIPDAVESVMFSAEDIQTRVAELGRQISEGYKTNSTCTTI